MNKKLLLKGLFFLCINNMCTFKKNKIKHLDLDKILKEFLLNDAKDRRSIILIKNYLKLKRDNRFGNNCLTKPKL